MKWKIRVPQSKFLPPPHPSSGKGFSLTLHLSRFRFTVIYQGKLHSYKLNRLQELTRYRFRISASNDAGQGNVSEVFTFMTTMAPPPSVKNLKTSEITQRSCLVEWQPCRLHSSDPVLYQVQISRVRNQDYKQVRLLSHYYCTYDLINTALVRYTTAKVSPRTRRKGIHLCDDM